MLSITGSTCKYLLGRESCNHRENSLSPLHVAAEAGNTRLYQFILERTEDKNPIWQVRFHTRWVNQWTPFLAAACYGNVETCLAIMDSLGVINPGNTQGITPLHAAAAGGHLQLCNAVLDKLQSQPTEFSGKD